MNTGILHKWIISLSATAGMLILLWFIGSAMAQGPQPQEDTATADMVQSNIHYQGVLYSGGSPVNGSRDMVFRLYSNDTCATQTGANIVKNGIVIAAIGGLSYKNKESEVSRNSLKEFEDLIEKILE